MAITPTLVNAVYQFDSDDLVLAAGLDPAAIEVSAVAYDVDQNITFVTYVPKPTV